MNTAKPMLIRACVLSGLDGAARELGFDVNASLTRFGIEPQMLSSRDDFISRTAFRDCLETLARELACPQLALLVARHSSDYGVGIMLPFVRACPTLGFALSRGYPRLRGLTDTQWRMQPDGERVHLVRTVAGGADGLSPQLQTLSVARHYDLLRDIMGESWRPEALCFGFEPPPGARQHYTRYFRVPVYFGQDFDGLVLKAGDLDIPLPSHDPETLAIFQRYFASPLQQVHDSFSGRISTLIRQHLGRDSCELTTIAAELGMHSKALQRALQAEGLTFRSLLQEVRLDMAEHYLSTSKVTLTRLAGMLGYSCPSALSRAFSQRHGLSPQRWRKQRSL